MIRAIIDGVVLSDIAVTFSNANVATDLFPDQRRSMPDRTVIAAAIEAGYDWLITCDKQMPYQQNLLGHAISVLVLATPNLHRLEKMAPTVLAYLGKPTPQHFVILDLDGESVGQPASHLLGKPARI